MSWMYCVRCVPGCEGHFADRTGRIWSVKRSGPGRRINSFPRERKPDIGRNGYLRYEIAGKKRLGHHLVLAAFGKPKPDGMQVRHINGVRDDNRIENLRWGTGKQNQADRVLHGTDNRGSKQGSAKLTESQVCEIKEMLSSGLWTQVEIAKRFNVSASNISSIANGASWMHLKTQDSINELRKRTPEMA